MFPGVCERVRFIPNKYKMLNRWAVRADGEKIPRQPDNPKRYARCNDLKTVSSYYKAENVISLSGGRLTGVSFLMVEEDGLTFIDLDSCLSDSGDLTAVAHSVVDRFRGRAFIEVSSSGHGVHIICRGIVPSIKTADIEMYSSRRFVAITGDSIDRTEPQDCQDDVSALYEWLVNRRERDKRPQGKEEQPHPINLSDMEIIAKAENSRGGDKFRCFMSGSWSGLRIGDGSQSSADLSFCNSLAFWTGGDSATMERIFRQSGMYRNDRKMMLAINKALQGTTTFYKGR